MSLDTHLSELKGVGPAVSSRLSIMGLKTVGDLIDFYPRRYDDYSNVQKIMSLRPGNIATVDAVVKSVAGRYVRRGMHITEAVISDDSGSMKVVWFNQAYRANAIKKATKYFISGKFEMSRGRLNFINPSMELVSDLPINTARILPKYRETKGLKSALVRKILSGLLPEIALLDETLPIDVIKKADLVMRSDAVRAMHFPESVKSLEAAKKRLGFEELFGITLASLINKKQFETESGVLIKFDEKLIKDFVARLPFSLTDAQRKVAWQIFKDLESTHVMNRLVEGDVGSGKTVVAAMACLLAASQDYQVAIMAPTEILANQHLESFEQLLKLKEKIVLLTSSVKKAAKEALKARIASGEVSVIIGTHALITEDVDFINLGLVIIDEQHRFGVEQRKALMKKAAPKTKIQSVVAPHVLSMTATPIPRTLALTLYGELDISIIDEMPPGRTPVITKLVSPNSKKPVYDQIRSELVAGRQMFVVCPLIEESDKLDFLSAEQVYEDLSKKVFKEFKVALLHGRMKPAEKEAVMAKFAAGKVNILVSTTVIEVGVNIPNATVMMIEGAERFGLAQIHQLRGRVGRGSDQAYCYLILSDSQEPSRRLRALENTTDGFKLAELDLEIRGPGAIYGQMQSGQLDLKVANLTDAKLIALARNSAKQFLESGQNLAKYPKLNQQVSKYRSVTNLN